MCSNDWKTWGHLLDLALKEISAAMIFFISKSNSSAFTSGHSADSLERIQHSS